MWIRLMRWIAQHFPANSIRVYALRACGFVIGDQVYIGPGLVLSTPNSDNSCMLVIEDRVSVGPGVSLILSSHCNHSRLNAIFPPVNGTVTLKKDCWLGAGVIVLPNVTIGEASAIAAGAVVTSSIEPHTLAGGVPAKPIRKLKHG
jgi:maltose O-acetyltransferase